MKQALALSLGLHIALAVFAGTMALFQWRRESWGGTGGGSAMNVGLVRSLPGVPLPRPDTVTTSRVVDDSRGLYKSEPRPEVRVPEAKALPEFSKAKQPKYDSRKSKVLEDESVPPPNAVPYGAGGAPSVPYSQFSMGGGQTQAGLGLTSGGGGDFGARFPWYVDSVRRRISSNWLQSTIDPSIRFAPRVVVTFQILGSGTITNVQILKSSGYPSVDYSARRAVIDSSPADRLPSGYAGSFVSVEFWFEFRR